MFHFQNAIGLKYRFGIATAQLAGFECAEPEVILNCWIGNEVFDGLLTVIRIVKRRLESAAMSGYLVDNRSGNIFVSNTGLSEPYLTTKASAP